MKMRFLFLLMVASFFSFGCSSDDNDVISQMEENSRYYVKYEVSMAFASGYGRPNMEITYLSDEGIQTITVPSSKWDGTYRPFTKNTTFSIKVNAKGTINNISDSYVRLSVSKDKEPFVIKGEDRGKSKYSLETSYTLDF